MRVLHIIQRYHPAIGGSETWCRNICRYLVSKGVVTKVATTNSYNMEEFFEIPSPEWEYARLGAFDDDDGVEVRRYKLWSFWTKSLSGKIVYFLLYKLRLAKTEIGYIFKHSPHSFEMYRGLFRAIRETDIVHLHTIPYFHNLLAYSIAKFYGKKIVITPYFHPGHKYYEKRIFFKMMNGCDAIIAISNFEKKYLEEKNIDGKKIYVTGCALLDDDAEDRKDIEALKEEMFERYGICRDSKKILFIGRKELYKGIGDLIEATKKIACEDHTKLTLFLIGPNGARFNKMYTNFADTDRLKLVNFNFVTEDEKEILLQECDMLALPSRYESFGIVFLEAWKHKKPVIGSSKGATPEVIGGGGLLAKYGDVDDLKNKLKLLLHDKALAKALGEEGKRKVEGEYSLDKIGEKVLNIYNSLKDKKRILVVSSFFPPHCVGGAEIVAYEQCKMLKKKGFDIKIFAAKLDDKRPQYQIEEERGEFDITWINIHKIDMDYRFVLLDKEAMQRRFKEALYDIAPDIVHFHNINAFSIKIIEECSKMHIPTIMTLHDFWFTCFKNILLTDEGKLCDSRKRECSYCRQTLQLSDGTDITARERNSLFLTYFHKIDKVISPSSYLAKRFIDYGGSEDSVRVIGCGVDISRFKKVTKRRAKKIRLAYIGQLVFHKGVENLLRAISLLTAEEKEKISLCIVGSGENSDNCKELVKELELRNIVRFRGNVKHKRIGRIFSKTDVLVIPSIWPDNAPVTILEAMATGTPALASDIGGVPELVQNGINGYLHRYDSPLSLAKNIRKIIKEPEVIERMKTACLQIAKENDLINKTGEIGSLYTEVLSRNYKDTEMVPRRLVPLEEHNIANFLGEGWYNVETDGLCEWAWSKKEAFLYFPTGHKGFSLRVQGCTNKERKHLTVSVFDLEKRTVNSYAITDMSNNQLDIPPEVSSIKIDVARLWRPNRAMDNRWLGICLHGVTQLRTYRDICTWPPFEYTIDVTRLCNMNPPCVMCPRSLGERNTVTPYIPEDLIEKISPYFKYAKRFILHGLGEPLMYKGLDHILSTIDTKAASGFNTNGLALTKEKAELLVSKGLKWIDFSIDAAHPETYRKIRGVDGLTKLKENIKNLSIIKEQKRTKYPVILVNITLMRENIKELPDFVMLAKEVGAQAVEIGLLNPSDCNHIVERDNFYFNYYEQMINNSLADYKDILFSAQKKAGELGLEFLGTKKEFNEIFNQKAVCSESSGIVSKIKKISPACKKPWEEIMVGINGDVRICCHLPSEESILGNLYEQSFEEIWNGPVARRVRRQFLDNVVPEECCFCPLGYVGTGEKFDK